MQRHHVIDLCRSFADAGVRYLFAGDLASIAAGNEAITVEELCLLAGGTGNRIRAAACLSALGYAPLVPERDVLVAAMSPEAVSEAGIGYAIGPLVEVEILLAQPDWIDAAWEQAQWWDVAETVRAPFLDACRDAELRGRLRASPVAMAQRDARHQRWARTTTYPQRLQWLDGANALVFTLHEQRRARGLPCHERPVFRW